MTVGGLYIFPSFQRTDNVNIQILVVLPHMASKRMICDICFRTNITDISFVSFNCLFWTKCLDNNIWMMSSCMFSEDGI